MVVAQERYGHRVPDFQIPCKATEEIGGVVASELGRWQKVTVPEPGDVVMMALNPLHPDTIQHFGTFVGDGRFLHTLEKSGSILSSIHHDYWSRKIRGYVRWAG
jgi:cell wall-associated NlpC family hydrolase